MMTPDVPIVALPFTVDLQLVLKTRVERLWQSGRLSEIDPLIEKLKILDAAVAIDANAVVRQRPRDNDTIPAKKLKDLYIEAHHFTVDTSQPELVSIRECLRSWSTPIFDNGVVVDLYGPPWSFPDTNLAVPWAKPAPLPNASTSARVLSVAVASSSSSSSWSSSSSSCSIPGLVTPSSSSSECWPSTPPRSAPASVTSYASDLSTDQHNRLKDALRKLVAWRQEDSTKPRKGLHFQPTRFHDADLDRAISSMVRLYGGENTIAYLRGARRTDDGRVMSMPPIGEPIFSCSSLTHRATQRTRAPRTEALAKRWNVVGTRCIRGIELIVPCSSITVPGNLLFWVVWLRFPWSTAHTLRPLPPSSQRFFVQGWATVRELERDPGFIPLINRMEVRPWIKARILKAMRE